MTKYINTLSDSFVQLLELYESKENIHKEDLLPIMDLINETLNEDI